jgi:predicted phosphodiesterase
MKIGLASDLHLEFERDWLSTLERVKSRAGGVISPATAATWRALQERLAEPGHPRHGPDLRALKAARIDLMLLPGDIHSLAGAAAYAGEVAEYLGCDVCFVAGNHEFYNHFDMLEAVASVRSAVQDHPQLHFLDGDRVDLTVDGRSVAILGATLWTDYALLGPSPAAIRRAMATAESVLSDHSHIRYMGRRFKPADALALHRRTREWLSVEAPRARQDAETVVIMTHHAPIHGANGIHEGGDLSPAFASDLIAEIEVWKPDLWVWGHTHVSLDTCLGATRLVSSQRGYLLDDERAAAETYRPAIIEIL